MLEDNSYLDDVLRYSLDRESLYVYLSWKIFKKYIEDQKIHNNDNVDPNLQNDNGQTNAKKN